MHSRQIFLLSVLVYEQRRESILSSVISYIAIERLLPAIFDREKQISSFI